MSSANRSENMLDELDQTLDIIKAGPDAIEPENLESLFQSINQALDATVGTDLLSFQPGAILTWNDIFETSAANRLAPQLSDNLNPILFYNYGLYLLQKNLAEDAALTKLAHSYLDIFRFSPFLKKAAGDKKWEILIKDLIVKSNFNFSRLFKQRVHDYPEKELFKVFRGNSEQTYTWKQASEFITQYSAGLAKLALGSRNKPCKIAFLMENSIEMAFLDLACLTSGIINIMIPANSVPSQIAFILNQTEAGIVLVANDKQLAKIKSVKAQLSFLQKAVLIQGSSIEQWILSFDDMLQDGLTISEERLQQMQQEIDINGLASIMYTSGTTGDPKGIMFSNLNIVYKRFCRALALPSIGDKDRYLAYLPLYHTFGRWLELTGAIFWGAQYMFMENPALSTLLDNMKRGKPTIFISIPKKWIQLYNYVASKVNIEFDDQKKIQQAVRQATGGELRWGLSAAGYLDPEVFLFFQAYGIELMSGFGMTEATGGITMTYPGQYIENSLGRPLPGIEVKLGDDGEMLIHGDYVMLGYYGIDDAHDPFVDGWFPTGDIMQLDDNGFYQIIDRKKEIYKNIKGETIAPQKIENYFRDFENVQQVFLAGDHKQFNTVLIYPNYNHPDGIIKKMKKADLQVYFSSVVVTVNKFLAPFERIVDFRIVERPFSADEGELTPKGTYKRRVIEANFETLIDSMYTKNYLSLFTQGTEVRVPNWFLREKGCLTHDLQMTDEGLLISKYDRLLHIKKIAGEKDLFQIGDYRYIIQESYIDFQIFLANPFYWLGNQQLLDFAGEAIFQWYRLDGLNRKITFEGIDRALVVEDSLQSKMMEFLDGGEKSLFGLNLAAKHLQSPNEAEALLGIRYLQIIFNDENLPVYNLAKEIVSHPRFSKLLNIRREMFKLGVPQFKGRAFEKYLYLFLREDAHFLTGPICTIIAKLSTGEETLFAIHALIKRELISTSHRTSLHNTALPSLLSLLAEFGKLHPTKYKRVRQLIVRYQLRDDYSELPDIARLAREQLTNGFRVWLGDNQQVSVDIETGNEYQWKDVVIFDELIPDDERLNLLQAIAETSLLREAIFLFSEGNMVRLYDIPPGGVWISIIHRSETKAVYRVSVQTRYQGSYDFVINLILKEAMPDTLQEMLWLIHAGAPAKGIRLVEGFGGYWADYKLWTEDFIPGDSVERYLKRSMRRDNEETRSRLYHIWPFFVWTATAAHVSFWRRTGYKLELKDKSADSIVIPGHDYQTGVRIISIAERQKSDGIAGLIESFYEQYVLKTEEDFPFLIRDGIFYYIFAGILDAEGEEKGLVLLKNSLADLKKQPQSERTGRLTELISNFINEIKKNGFIPKTLYFAIRRFHRWANINKNAAFSAQARTLNELYDTYRLQELETKYPETRARFFLETVFEDSVAAFRDGLLEIVHHQHERYFCHDDILSRISGLSKEFKLTDKERFFLSRLSFPHLKPTDSAVLVTTPSDGAIVADVVVRLEDYDGMHYQVRKPVSPKEISRLHQLFLDASLPVNFRPEHRFIVAVSERGYVVGGLFYSYIDEQTVYMEKVVVSNQYRRKGISEGLMNEFFNRLRDERINFVTTGFFRPEYFYRFGFKVERKYSGLVKDLRAV